MRANLPGAAGPRADVDVGGPTALIKDFDDRVSTTQPLVFVFVALIAFVMLLISIRSVFLALKGVLMTVLSVAAAYGSLVVVFEWGWFEALGFKQLESIDSTIPPLVLAMTFGLSMDYEIFLLTRIRERFLQTNNTRDAVAYGVSTSARTITSAALIMIAVFIGFAFAGMPLVAQLGVACAVAIAVDATVVRLVLVPALMAMFAQWNWWLPGWLDRILPSVDFEKPLPKADIGDLVIIPEDISTLGPSGCGHPHRRALGREVEDPRPADPSPWPTRWRSAAADRRAPRSAAHVKGGDEPLVKLRPLGRGHKVNGSPRNGAQRQAGRPNGTNGTHGAPTIERYERNPRGQRLEPHAQAAPADPSGHRVARPAHRRARRPVHRGRDGSAGRAAAEPDGDHQRSAANRRPTANPHRCGDAAAQELSDHVPEQCPRLRRVCRIGRVHGHSNGGVVLAGMDRYYCGQRSRNSGWPHNWSGDWPTRTRRTSTTRTRRVPMRTKSGHESGSAACRLQ